MTGFAATVASSQVKRIDHGIDAARPQRQGLAEDIPEPGAVQPGIGRARRRGRVVGGGDGIDHRQLAAMPGSPLERRRSSDVLVPEPALV